MTYDRVKKSSWTPPAKATSSFFPQTHIQTKKETKPSWEVTGVHTSKEAMERIRRTMFGNVEPIVEAPKETAPQETQQVQNPTQVSEEAVSGEIQAKPETGLSQPLGYGVPSQQAREGIRRRMFGNLEQTPVQKQGEGTSPPTPLLQGEGSQEQAGGEEKGLAETEITLPIQAKLTIGEPNDKYEQEADRVARQVVDKIHSPTPERVQREEMGDEDEVRLTSDAGSGGKVEAGVGVRGVRKSPIEGVRVNRKVNSEGETSEASAELEASIQGKRGSGQPLDESVREPMEREFGADFSGVRVHTDTQSDELNQAIQAKAFTTGEDIFFREGAYEPGSKGGQELLAHELTHVVQQNSTNQKNIQSVVNRISPFLIQRGINKEDVKKNIKNCKTPAEMGSSLKTKVKIKNVRDKTTWNLRRLSQVGLAIIEYIYDNQDEGDIDSTDTGKLNAAVYWIDTSDKKCSPKAEIIAEVEAVMETIAAKARCSEGGGLLHKTGEKQWAYQKPSASTPERLATEEERKKLKFWESPTDKPAPTDATPDAVHTPGGSEMPLVTSYRYNSPGGTQHATHTYAKEVPPREPDLAATVAPTGTPKLGRCLVNFKRVGPVTINKKLLDSWASQRQGWTPDQNAAMKNTSAKEAAAASSYPTNQDWQWLHLIAFTFGGHDGQQPNAQENLVAGLAAANGFHLVLENLVKKMILSSYTDEIEIQATAHITTGSYHVAEKIYYSLKWKDSSGKYVIDEFTINTLDPNKAMGGHLSMLYTQFAIDSSPVHHETTKEYNDAIAFLQKGQPVGTSKAAQAAYASYQDGIKALQAGNPVRPSKAAQAAEKDYQDAISDLHHGNPVGLSEAAQAAKTDYNNAIADLQAGNAVGASAAAQAANTDYNNAIADLQAGNAVGASAAAQAADADYQHGFNDATGGIAAAQQNNPGYMAGFNQVHHAAHNAAHNAAYISDLSPPPPKRSKTFP